MAKKPTRPPFIAAPTDEQARPYRWCGYTTLVTGIACSWWAINTLFVEQHGGSGEAWLSVWSAAISWIIFYRCSKRSSEIDP